MTVLLVDDSRMIRKMQENHLADLGASQIYHANDGREALDVLAQNMPIDLILLDWNMPVMDGYSCLKEIRANDAYKKVKVVMCTSESEKSSVIEALTAGANNYIVKPFSKETIQEKLGL